MMRTIRIGKEVVVLSYTVHDGKVTVGELRSFPVGVWKNICRCIAQ